MSTDTTLSEELHRIPRPAFVIAVLVFLGVVFALSLVFEADADTATWPLAARLALAVLVGGVLAVYVLLIGYVNVDARRRDMSRWLWTLVVILVPNALGFVFYFLLRRPVHAQCPACGHSIEATAHYCSRCGRQLGQACPNCHRAVGLDDAFCSNCGVALGNSSEPRPIEG